MTACDAKLREWYARRLARRLPAPCRRVQSRRSARPIWSARCSTSWGQALLGATTPITAPRPDASSRGISAVARVVETARHLLRLLAAATALSIASVHVAILNRHLDEKTYVGALFLAAILALQFVALELAQSRRDPLLDAAAWIGGSAIVSSMFALFVVSRTVGLPGYREPWDKIGIASLALEGLFVALAAASLALRHIAVSGSRIGDPRRRIEAGVAPDLPDLRDLSVSCSPSPQIAGAVSLGSRDRPRSQR